MESSIKNPGLTVIYDGECPFCSRYVAMVRLREAVGTVILIDARHGGPAVDNVRAMGFDLNEGMVALYGGRVFYGADCVNFLAEMSTDHTILNKLNGWMFRSKARSDFLYPFMRAGRNATLRLLGRTKIQNP